MNDPKCECLEYGEWEDMGDHRIRVCLECGEVDIDEKYDLYDYTVIDLPFDKYDGYYPEPRYLDE